MPYEYHRAIADASGLPMVLFQLQPALAGVIFSQETLLKLISIPNVIAIKEASFDAVRFVETVRVLSEAPKRIQVLTGNDNFILESFLLGADGALIGFGTLAIAEQIEMIASCSDGDVNGAREIYDERHPAACVGRIRAAGAQLPSAGERSAGRVGCPR